MPETTSASHRPPASTRAVYYTTALRAGRWVSVLGTLLAAAAIITHDLGERRAVVAQIAAKNHLKLAGAASAVESYLSHVETTLKTISAEPAIRKLRADSRDYVQAIYESNYARHLLAEIYVVDLDFDGTRRPFLTFEHGENGAALEEIHTLEREQAEYTVQMDQIRRFADGSVTGLVGPPIPLCTGETGVVFAVPIYDDGQLRGSVAGMIRSITLERIIDTGDTAEFAALLTRDGCPIVCPRLPADARRDLATRRAALAAASAAPLQLGRFRAISREIAEPESAGWTIVLLTDPAAQLAGVGAFGTLSGWGAGALVVLLGCAVALLCQAALALIGARHEAVERTHALAHAARVTTVGELTAGIAHELNQPLAAIASYAEACVLRVRRGCAEPHEMLVDIEEINVQTQRAAQIVERVRQFIRKGSVQRELADLNQLAREAVHLLESELRSANVHVSWALHATLPRVRVDSMQITQVFVNLVRNAIEAMQLNDAGQRALTIQTARHSADVAQCTVADDGPPLSDHEFDQLFTPFVTTKASGLGLGMTICRNVVDAHGGRVWAARGLRRGLVVHFTLPIDHSEVSNGR